MQCVSKIVLFEMASEGNCHLAGFFPQEVKAQAPVVIECTLVPGKIVYFLG